MQAESFKNPYGIPKWVVFQLTEACNLRCRMCYEWGKEGSYHSKKEIAQLDTGTVKRVIERCSPGRPYFGLFGGEPLLHPGVEEILSTISHYGCSVDIPTNGVMLEKHAEMLVETKPSRLWISLDGPREINDAQRGDGVFKKVTDGINKLFDVRESRGSEYPKIGITIIVTPLNYSSLEEFFFKCIDITKLDHLSIEFQLYANEQQCSEYEALLRNEFGVEKAPGARGIIWDNADFRDIDVQELVRQIQHVREFCEEKNIYFICYPKTIECNNFKHFYNAEWGKMADYRSRCTLPWLYAEINARGDVTTCHTFYDLTHGNVYEQDILDIWRSDSIEKFRKLLRKNLLPICTACSRYYRDPGKK